MHIFSPLGSAPHTCTLLRGRNFSTTHSAIYISFSRDAPTRSRHAHVLNNTDATVFATANLLSRLISRPTHIHASHGPSSCMHILAGWPAHHRLRHTVVLSRSSCRFVVPFLAHDLFTLHFSLMPFFVLRCSSLRPFPCFATYDPAFAFCLTPAHFTCSCFVSALHCSVSRISDSANAHFTKPHEISPPALASVPRLGFPHHPASSVTMYNFLLHATHTHHIARNPTVYSSAVFYHSPM